MEEIQHFQAKSRQNENEKKNMSAFQSSLSFHDGQLKESNEQEYRKRSTNGCVTCKIRKKRCDEGKPICTACRRLNRRCAYIEDYMTKEEIKQLKETIEVVEQVSKSRIRKKKNTTTNTEKESKKSENERKKRKNDLNKKIIFNPLAMNMASTSFSNLNIFSNMAHQTTSYMENNNNVDHGGDSSTQFKNYIDFLSIDQKNSKVSPNLAFNTGSVNESTFSPSSLFTSLENGMTPVGSTEIPQLALDNTDIVRPQLMPYAENQRHTDQIPEDEFTGIFSNTFPRLLQEHFKFEDPFDGDTNITGTSSGKDDDNMQNDNENSRLQLKDTHNKVEEVSDIIEVVRQHTKTSPELYVNPSVVQNSTLATLSDLGKTLYEYYRDRLSFIVCSAPKKENMYLNTFLPMAHVDKSVLYGILAWSAFHMGGESMVNQGNYYIKLALKNFRKRPLLSCDFIEQEGSGLVYDVVDETDEALVREPTVDADSEVYEDLELGTLKRDNLINMRLAAFLILCGVEICKGDVSRWSKYLTYGAELICMKGGLKKFSESKDEHFLVTNYAYHDITAIQVTDEKTIHFDLKEYEEMWCKSNELEFTDPLHGISSPVFKLLAEINTLVAEVQRMTKRRKRADKSKSVFNVSDSPNDGKNDVIFEEVEKSSTTSSIEDMFKKIGSNKESEEEEHDNEDDDTVPAEELERIMNECMKIEERILAVKPKLSPDVTPKDLELQLTIFECFQITARIYLRQSVLRVNSGSVEIQMLTGELIKVLDVLLGSEFEACLCLPMFIAGMNCVTRSDRSAMMKRFTAFIERYRWKNVVRCQIIIRYVWKLNCKGDKFVDWHAIVKTLGWDLSFA